MALALFRLSCMPVFTFAVGRSVGRSMGWMDLLLLWSLLLMVLGRLSGTDSGTSDTALEMSRCFALLLGGWEGGKGKGRSIRRQRCRSQARTFLQCK